MIKRIQPHFPTAASKVLRCVVRSCAIGLCVILLSITAIAPVLAEDSANTIARPVLPKSATNSYTVSLDWEKVGELREAAFAATQAGEFDLAEEKWSELIEQLPEAAPLWSNRGNVRVRRNDLAGAIADYNQAITLAPTEPDPYLNRGALREAMGEWEAAIADYNQVLQIDPDDPAAYNNRGNAEAGLGEWDLAIADYQAAITLQPSFSLAYGNYALALYETGDVQKSLQIMKSLVRKYPSFVDMRAALTAALWETGQRGEAESNWVAVVGLDTRYKDLKWVKDVRRWPPKMVTALEHFLTL
ncbi:tetratricopeptide repeat protein [Synechococcus sp. PCC 7335]|uniref:tetratricopeptide repeat protein n=1 Tax=Synechococcus sp. (strain ATCC 29403 / PCC 7335) TaxID=91464 RepID=UPI000A01FD50|nr:tetratricopeptide repeat protein [Synechococcus sp. PCC 7335]